MYNASKETLKSGKVLEALLMRFRNDPSEENLFPVLNCLSDSDLLVPMNARITDSMKEEFLKAKKGDVITLNEELRMQPDILVNNDVYFFPIFSSKEQINPDYEKNFSWISMDILECINLLKSNDKANKFILNAFSHQLVLDADLVSIIENIIKEKSKK